MGTTKLFCLAACMLLFTACGGSLRPIADAQKPPVYPPTWTLPRPTESPTPEPTATLVIRSTPQNLSPNASGSSIPPATVNGRRFPVTPYGKIGTWADTLDLRKDDVTQLAPRLQIATGDKQFLARQANANVIALARLDAAQSKKLSPTCKS